ncbi:MAG: AraC family transcriptional regulator [Bacteroidota bacterium]
MKANIEAVLIYLSTNFRQPLKMKELAEMANLSEYHFYRVFKQETQFTPQKYVEQLRLEHAAHTLVLNPDMKKTHLAFDTGFQSPSSFTRSFTKYFGRSPSEFLRRHQANREVPPQVQERLRTFAPIDICYLQGQMLSTQLLSLAENRIQQALDAWNTPQESVLYGVYLDTPFHIPLPECRYLLGVEAAEKGNFQIEGGYYLRILMSGPIQDNLHLILEQHQRLEQNGYRIKEPIGIEKMKWKAGNPLSYHEIPRELFIPVC